MTGALIGGSLIGAGATYFAGQEAAGAQEAAANQSAALQKAQFEAMREDLLPYTQVGVPALNQMQAISGSLGADAQQRAITGIEQSPLFNQLALQGENAMLQQASATGGLRGGNTQAALAQFRPQLLNQMISEQYNRLGGLAQIGQSSAAGTGTAGMQMASNVGNAYTQAGAAQAGAALATGQAIGGIGGDISSAFMTNALLKNAGMKGLF
jgi:hypothetical protein